MNFPPYIEALAAAALGWGGFAAGRLFGRQPRPVWILGYVFPLIFVILLALGRLRHLDLAPPISWLMAGRTELVIAAPIITMILTTPLTRVVNERTRRMVVLFMVLLASLSSVWPLLAPLVSRPQLRQLQTTIDTDGICLQTTEYTCGPAASVTILRRLGYPAEEGELGLLAGTSSATGTAPDILQEALQTRYGPDGLTCRYRHFDNLEEVRAAVPVIAVIKYSLFVDHYVAVIKVTDEDVVVGDPMSGLRVWSRDEFSDRFRWNGIELDRPHP